ncbi:YeiH family protein [Cohnella sp. GCM10020058]|uniref:YeiH family protein n=1 Tax=Cohnella sp. GCM10020058 TaxID=3317330 RepID=UPI00363ECA76
MNVVPGGRLQPERLSLTRLMRRSGSARSLVPGLALAAALALLGWQLARIPGFGLFGPMACTLLAAVAYRQLFGYSETLAPGVRFGSTKLLRAAIILFGLKLPLGTVLQQGLPLLARSVGTLAFSLAAGLALGRLLKADRQLTLLLAVGTGICGAAAIAAVSPLIAAREDRTATAAGLIAVVGTVAAVASMLLADVLPLSGTAYGLWTGLTLHEIAHVAMAASAGGPDALASGMLAKLARVFLLVPLCLALHLRNTRLARRRITSEKEAAAGTAASFPWFLIGFLAMSLLYSGLTAVGWTAPPRAIAGASTLTTALLTVAMAGMGLNVNVRTLRQAMRPIAVLLIVSALLSGLTLLTLL